MTTFKTTSRLVVLDVVVTDPDGKVVRGLAKEDFTVFENGQPQRITQFETDTEHVPNQVSGTTSPLNILVLDELNTTFEEALFSRRSLIKYLESQPGQLPSPTMVLAVTNTDVRLLHDYTQDRNALLGVLRKRQPDYPWKLMRGWVVDRLARCLVALQQIATANAGRPVRKNVVWIGRGFPSVNFSDETETSQRETVLEAVNRTTSRLLDARVTVYTIDPKMTSSTTNASVAELGDGDLVGTNSPTDPWYSEVNFANFGPSTGGKAFRSRNDIDKEIGESVYDGSTYYTLAYVPSIHSDDRPYRAIRIKMRQPGLRARTRDGYFGRESKLTPGMIALDISQAAQNPFQYSGLELSVIPSPMAGKPNRLSCMVHVDPRSLTWSDAKDGALRNEVELAVAAFSRENKLLSYVPKKFASTNTPDQRKDLFQMPARFLVFFDLPQGTARLRFVLRDATSGRIGTIDRATDQLR